MPDVIGTCLWFEDRAVEAAEFYVSLFPESRIVDTSTVAAGSAKGGEEGYCGWLNDRFGVSWQVMPATMGELMSRDPGRVMEALLKMGKIDIDALRRAGTGNDETARRTGRGGAHEPRPRHLPFRRPPLY